MSERLTVKQLVEKVLKYKFSNDENWQDPQFLRDHFTNHQLSSAAATLTTRIHGNGPYSHLYGKQQNNSLEARQLLKDARQLPQPHSLKEKEKKDTEHRRAERFTVKHLVENGLKQRFSDKENWQDPQFLRDRFSNDQLTSAISNILTRERKEGSSMGVYQKEAAEAKQLLKQARRLGKFASSDEQEAPEEPSQKSKKRWDSQGNPESFYQRLQQDRAKRGDFDKGGRQ